ncbi:MAG: hypothetical protein LBK60_06705 [Verrucomicrobiales bacterium]|jgi:hypothetical protein|nr:hypothetical protein [Verrucomicrobiales bacterium]
MPLKTDTFASLDHQKGVAPLPMQQGEEWPLPAWYRSVYDTPLDQLTITDLSRAVGQQLHVEQLMPLVIERLKVDPLAGEWFDGQLLASLCSVTHAYWKTHPNDWVILKKIINTAWNNLPEDVCADVNELLQKGSCAP